MDDSVGSDPTPAAAAPARSAVADIVEDFFKAIPCPENHHELLGDMDMHQSYFDAIRAFVSFSRAGQSDDPDYDFILRATSQVKCINDVPMFWEQLAYLAGTKQISDDDNSMKAQQLEYYHWMSYGRQDYSAPIPVIPTGGIFPAGPVSRMFLPDFMGFCSNCGSQNNLMGCEYCITVAYCSRRCRKKQRKFHKPYCRARMSLYRAAHIFRDLFFHVREKAYSGRIKEISEDNRMVTLVEDDHDDMAFQGCHAITPLRRAPTISVQQF
ncbi:hypothetical protein AAE478_004861 [Parahypoxylon ruwenzoriense]